MKREDEMANFRKTLIALCGSTAILTAMPAWAQDSAGAEEDTGGIQDIVVTAQKRAESAQDVPIAISVFSGSELGERAVGNVSQLTSVAPNVNFDNGVAFTGSTAVLAASIRGIGSSDFAFNIDPGVGIYVDGIYLARSVGANQDLLDTGRIEVLKGPQGTLFGRNTIGGAVSIVTRDPAKEFTARGDFTLGRFDMFEARGAIDIPLSDTLTSLITFDVRESDGYSKRIPFPSPLVANSTPFTALPSTGYNAPSKEGGSGNRSVRAKLKYDGGGFRLTLSGDYQKSTGTAANSLLGVLGDPAVTGNPNFTFLYNTCRAAPAAVLTGVLGLGNFCSTFGTQLSSVRRNEVTPINRINYTPGVNTGPDPSRYELLYTNQFITGDPDTSYASGNNFSRLRNYGATLNGEIDLGANTLLKSITGYRRSKWLSGLDVDGSPLNILHTSFDQRQKQFSQEFQLVGSALDSKLNYVVGAYFFKESGYLLDLVSFAQGAVQIDGPNWFKTTNYAGFTQVDYRVNDLIGITIGGRYTTENKRFEGGQQEVNGLFYKLVGSAAFAGTPLGDIALNNVCANAQGQVFPNAVLPGFGGATCQQVLGYPTVGNNNPLRVYAPGINTQKFNNFSPKFGVQLHPSEDVLVYGSYSAGYKTGGWTTRYTTPQTTAASFDPEKAKTFEVGVKSTLLDRHLQVNLAAFTTKYTGIQLNYQVGTSPTIDNVGDARIKGVELEIIAKPASILTINGSLGYIDSRYTFLDPAVQVTSAPNSFQLGAVVGGDLPKTPHWKLNLSPRIDLPIGDDGAELSMIADYTYTSKQRNNVEGTIFLNRGSVSLINASLIYKAPDEKYAITLGGTNLTNKRYITSGSSIPASGVIAGTFSRPREWYARVGFKF
jgi:iron complex outermembrane recepter protein